MQAKVYRVLIVDDDENDRCLIADAFEESLGPRGIVRSVAGADEGIAYLRGEGPFRDRTRHPFPTLIILDLKMARGDGFSLLQFLGHNPAWSVVPRVVFSGSEDEDDIKKAYLVGASAYQVKPQSGADLRRVVRAIVDYWGRCETPPVDPNGRLLITESRGKLGERIAQPEGGASMERVDEDRSAAPGPAGRR